MPGTYKALLKDDRLEWSDEAPDLSGVEQPVAVHVTILDQEALQSQRQAQGQRMAAALEQLAAMAAFTDIADPVAWQRETRQDRPLPGRES